MIATPTRDDVEARPMPQVTNGPRDFVPGDDYFAAAAAPFGSATVPLAIGPLRFSLDGLSPRQAERLGIQYAPFVSEGQGEATLTIGVRRAGVPGFLALPGGAAEIYRMGSRRSGSRLALWSYEFAGWVEASGARACLRLVEEEGPLFDRGLENFLRAMTASFILEQGGLLVHGSCVVRRGRAYVFFGPSGSGKTTVTRLSPNDTVLSDDLTLLVPSADGHAAAGIPFGMAHHRPPDTNAAFPVASLNRLVQSPSVRRERIEGARAVAELLASLPFVMQETRQAALAADTAERVLRTVPAFRLHFREDASFWDVVEEA